jgi:hypothetical protein
MEMFNSIPADKRPRVSYWLETGDPTGDYDWKGFLVVLKVKFDQASKELITYAL